MGTYEVPEDYNYLTGGTLKKDKRGRLLPGQITPTRLNDLLFNGHASSKMRVKKIKRKIK